MIIAESELRRIIRQVISEEKRLDEKFDIIGGLKKAGTLAVFLTALSGGQASAQELNKPGITQQGITQQVAARTLSSVEKKFPEFFTAEVLEELKNATTVKGIEEIAMSLYAHILEKEGVEGLRAATKFQNMLIKALRAQIGAEGGVTSNWSKEDFEAYQKRKK